MAKMSDVMKGATKVERPSKFPSLTDWVIFFFGEPTAPSPAIPMQLKVTSGDPSQGTVSGIAFVDPGTTVVDERGQPVPMPPIIPVANIPYSKRGAKGTWASIADFRGMVKAQQKADTQHQSTAPEVHAEVVDAMPQELEDGASRTSSSAADTGHAPLFPQGASDGGVGKGWLG